MVGLVVRKRAQGLLGYFKGDFGSRIWVDESGKPLLHPLVGKLRRGDNSIPPWETLGLDQFRSMVSGVDSERGTGEILGLELGVAPPKSVSVAALADSGVSPEIIGAHRSAVDDVLGFLSRQLVARAEGKLVDCGVRLFQFPHPWNRGEQPQLHSHVVLLRDHAFSHALWTTVVFLMQRSLREVYHYSLASRLVANDFGLMLGAEGSLAWELKGVPGDVLRRFSDRSRTLRDMAIESPKGYFSLGAEFRVAGWASRRSLPATDHSMSLAQAREIWRKKFPAIDLFGHSPRVETIPLALDKVFRRSSVLTREQFVASHLGEWIGARTPLPEAITMASRILAEHVESGRLLRYGDVYCHPESQEVEGEVLSGITEGFDGGEPLFLRKTKPRASHVKKILATRNTVKIISTDGEPPPKQKEIQTAGGKRFTGLIKNLKHWDCSEILSLIEKRRGQSVVIFIEEPVSVGDFGSRSNRLLLTGKEALPRVDDPFVVGNRRVLVQRGELEGAGARSLNHIQKAIARLLGMDPVSADRNCVTLLPGVSPERLRDLNWRMLGRTTAGREKVIYRLVPWEKFFGGSWENLGMFAFSDVVLPVEKKRGVQRTIQGGKLWYFEGPPQAGMITVRAKVQSKLTDLRALAALIEGGNPNLVLVESVKVTLSPGTPLAAAVRYEEDHQVFLPGEVHVVDSVAKDGTVRFASGRYWPNTLLVMEPAFFVPGFTRTQPRLSSIRVAPPILGDRLAWLRQLPAADLTVVACADPSEFCRYLQRNSIDRGRAKRLATTHQIIGGEWTGDLALLFPSAAQWKMLSRQIKPKEEPIPEASPSVSPLDPPEGGQARIGGAVRRLDHPTPNIATANRCPHLPLNPREGSGVAESEKIAPPVVQLPAPKVEPRSPSTPSGDGEII